MLNFKQLQSIILLSLGIVASAWAQERQITGQVTEETGEPIPGVTVLLKGTTKGSITDIDGKYHIQSSNDKDVLVFSFVGYQSKEISVGGQSTINVALPVDTEELDEVVVIGYGTSEKSAFTGSATMVDAGQVENIQTSNPVAGLEGTVPGLSMTGITGQPGSSPNINIRGFSSINQSQSPLIILDGTPYDGPLNAINPKDIESFSVLKDASGTAIYGSRATNGIIMITTKNGKNNKPTINFSARYGVSQRAFKEYDRVDEKGYYELMFQAYKNDIQAADPNASEADIRDYVKHNLIDKELKYNAYNVPNDEVLDENGHLNPNAKLLYSDDWQKEMFGTAKRQEYNLSINGGNENSDYFISTGYLNEEGIVNNSGFEKLTTRVKANTDVKPWLKVGANLNYAYTKSRSIGATKTSMANPFYTTRIMGPIYPVYARDAQGNIINDDQGNRMYDFGSGETLGQTRPFAPMTNVVAVNQLDVNGYKRHNLGARGFISIDFLKDFNFKSNISTDIIYTNSGRTQNKEFGDASAVGGRSYKTNSLGQSYTFNQVLTYHKQIADRHGVNVTLGHENYKYSYDYLHATRSGYPISGLTELAAASNTEKANSYLDEHTIESYFGRVGYNFDQKYFVDASFRKDGSSRFSKQSRWGSFWSLGASWRVSQENFMQDVSWVNDLKLRASYGVVGNEGVTDDDGYQVYYPWDALYDMSYSNASANGGKLTSLSNPNLMWEKNVSTNLAVDFALFNRLSGTVEYYIRDSKDLIMDQPLAPSLGFDSVTKNVGAIRNKGIEISLSYDAIKAPSGFNWTVGFIGSKVYNEITELSQDQYIKGTKLWKVGNSIYDFYLVDYAGVDPQTGDALYWRNVMDAEGNPTGAREKTTDYDGALNDSRKVVGSAIPDFQGSINNMFSYKGFDLSILATFSLGGKIYDNTYADLMMPTYGQAMSSDLKGAWQKPGDITDIPRLEARDDSNVNKSSSRFLTDATYFGIRNITLGYTFQPNLVKKLKVGSMRTYITADNIWYSTQRQGLYINPARSGITSYNYVPVRTISVGLDLTL
ncbi:TonB-dependent receptor [Flammeovirga sp. MY04]|uniref:SusC/RagA family TonB-linked outer membrane protein n=1 Tax=Flammeovirga sp. MY04 TaxID=1191459 RepID=UPI00080642F4|nr:TonB-dependent receptor [Flammeovirga sp. MY04]ANQ52311.1 TonB-dependent receptor [Flammeovirga sp. MY04]